MLLVNKPKDWTSFDVVARTRSLFHIAKIGHAGTLDPKATGLLILCTGRMTKSIDSFSVLDKEYTGLFEVGSRTKSFDSETEVIEIKDSSHITAELISNVMKKFIGHQKQVPPMYSAVKKNGRRLYKDARKGRVVEREARDIFIKEFSLLSFSRPLVEFKVVCSKGTYVRSLVNDIGAELGCGAYLKELKRTRIGEYTLQESLSLDDLQRMSEKAQSTQWIA